MDGAASDGQGVGASGGARPLVLRAGRLSLTVEGGAARWIRFDGVEVIRGIDAPVRDENWATLPADTVRESCAEEGDTFTYSRTFRAGDLVDGTVSLHGVDGPEATLTAKVRMTLTRAASLNRAGFTVLHPLAGVTGAPFAARHPDGTTSQNRFPEMISPGQPVFNLAGLSHTVRGVGVDIGFDGEVFEMEDQRNWTDASYKTYCRPLGWPRPFALAQGETIEQTILVRLSGAGEAVAADASHTSGRVPAVLLALEDAIAPIADVPVPALRPIDFTGVQLRAQAADVVSHTAQAGELGLPIDLEVVVPASQTEAALMEAAAASPGPRRVTALPAPYLGSIQPEGPWPTPTPADTTAMARTAFAGAEIGTGVLTNFTEFNRCPPSAPSDFVTFGTTAIVHAADDASVIETLEAIPHVLRSARALAGERPIRLGLVSIAMRSNPYGAAVVDNPDGETLAMVMDDPRQRTVFGAAFAVGALAAAIEEGVASLSLSMATGPLGILTGASDGRSAVPLYHVVRTAAALSGEAATVTRNGPVFSIMTERAGICGLAANFGPASARLPLGDRRAVLLPDGLEAPDWLADAPRVDGPLTLEPGGVVVIVKGEGGL